VARVNPVWQRIENGTCVMWCRACYTHGF
jgi:hypothetical protein